MATIQASALLSSFSSASSSSRVVKATLYAPKLGNISLSIPKLKTQNVVEELNKRIGYPIATTTLIEKPLNTITIEENSSSTTTKVIAEFYAIKEVVADRIEMHANIGEQRNNWNTLLLTSINTITLTAATMAALAATITGAGIPLLALKLSSTLLYSSATAMLLVMNKIQPSQLAEEQRNAARLFKQLHGQIETKLSLGNPTSLDVKETMEKVLAIDRAYPLPLLGAMLDKFPKTVRPAVWWPSSDSVSPSRGLRYQKPGGCRIEGNGWNEKLEEEMREILKVMKRKDSEDYMRLSRLVLKINKILAISSPLLTGIAAVGSAFAGSSSHGSLPGLVGVLAGALATVSNTLGHGGQVGMVFEMYRNCAGFFQLMEETIQSTLNEREVEKRENGDLFEMKVALQLGRSLSELRDLAKSSSSSSKDEFASKLF